ncbi:helix-turn-helix domain-containing protein [Comamonas koreensis]|uniref:helix-turn-helix domain-containing protein n=1 Tax=Comamonas koreensis TaxID=160825 RepID=UPI0015FD45A2|nr:helix-turn-helix domain-containing protein [Comamonas koreensis]
MAKQFTPEMEKRLIEMRKKGLSARQVAAELGVAKSTAASRMALLPKPCGRDKLGEKLGGGSISFKPGAKIVMPKVVKIQRHVSVLSDKAPVCNATVRGLPYDGKELAYRR